MEAFKINAENVHIEVEDFQKALATIRPSAIRESFVAIPNVQWSEVGGLRQVKRDLEYLVVQSLKHPEKLAAAGIVPPRGIVLHGPSGCGKTMLAQAIATEAGVNFLAVDGPEIFGKWLGESEAAIRHIFRVARQLSPTVIFFDQLDAIAPQRGNESGSRTTERVVNQLLSELDGVKSLSDIIVIAATNRLDLVDASILRPGRLGARFKISLPDEAERLDILSIILHGVRMASFEDVIARLAHETEGRSGADLKSICEEAKFRAFSMDQRLSWEHFDSAIRQMRKINGDQ
jgi:transitional endoplasmic reticulum ATPase